MIDVPAWRQAGKGSKFPLTQHFFFYSGLPWIEWGQPALRSLLSLLDQMLISSRNILIDPPVRMLNQICGHPVIQLSRHMELTIIWGLNICMFVYAKWCKCQKLILTENYIKVNHNNVGLNVQIIWNKDYKSVRRLLIVI